PSAVSARSLVSGAEHTLAQGHPGQAILNLERARLLDPRSPTIAAELAQARAAANLPAVEPRLAGTTRQILRADEWGHVALIGLGFIALGVVSRFWRVGGRPAFLAAILVGAAVALAGTWAAVRGAIPPNLAVVVAPDAMAYVAPSTHAQKLFEPPEGSLVLIEGARGDYALIRAAALQGWVSRRDVETILPEGHEHL
ncbi:MAG TPA: hypothetical protein VI456_12180, partial [Polyangia bacterium]